jgi:hypothetical protein
MPTARRSLGLAVVDGKIYAIGGVGKDGKVGTNEMYDPATDNWTTKAPMPTSRSGFGIVVWNNLIYVMGGGSSLTDVYDPVSDFWFTRAPAPLALGDGLIPQPVAVIDGKIWLVYVNTTLVKNPDPETLLINELLLPNPFPIVIQIYDPAMDTWTLKTTAPDPYPRRINSFDLGSALFVGEKIFLILNPSGHTNREFGQEYPNPMQIYDPKSDTWSQGASLPLDAMFAGSAASSGINAPSVYVVGGGYSPQFYYNQVYDVQSDSWVIGEPLSCRTALAAVCVDDLLFAIGGQAGVGYISDIQQYTPVGYRVG